MDFFDDFVQAAPDLSANLRELDVRIEIEDETNVRSGRSTDLALRRSAVETPVSDVDWECSTACKYKRTCAYNYGFLPFVTRLRNDFWGKTVSDLPSTSSRKDKIELMVQSAHHGGHIFKFGYTAFIDGHETKIDICESAFFKALGSGKTSQWYSAMKRVAEGLRGPVGRDRVQFKSASVRAYISLFLEKCDMPPSKNMQHIKILPFPNLTQFYNEYGSTFNPQFLDAMEIDVANRFEVVLLLNI